MTTSNVNNLIRATKFVIQHEGGYSNDPNDPGGETKWGISKRAHPTLDIRNLTPEQAASIYETEYWNPSGCDAVPFPECVAVFDTAINCGVARTRKWLQQTANIYELIQERVNHYTNLVAANPKMQIYLKGWLNRVNDLKKYLEINAEGGDA